MSAGLDRLPDFDEHRLDAYLDPNSDISASVRRSFEALSPDRIADNHDGVDFASLEAIEADREFSLGPERRRWWRR